MTLDLADLGSAGITAATLTTTSQGVDTLQLTCDGPLDSTPLLAPFEQFTLTADGGTRFTGWLDQAPRADSGSESSHTYTLTGPMRWLDRSPFVSETSGGIIVFDDGGGALLPLDTMLRRILASTQSAQPGRITHLDSDLDAPILQHPVPPEIRLDSTCETCLRRALSYAPTVGYWWEYSAFTPTLRLRDCAQPIPDHTLSDSAYDLSQIQMNPRYDLLHDTLKIYWLSGRSLARLDTVSPAGDAAALGANRTLIQTFELGSYNLPVEGIGNALAKYYQRLHIECTATMESLDWSHHPAELWSYAGLLANEHTSFAYTITRDLFALTQTLTLGVPPALGIYQLSEGTSSGGGGGSGGGDDPPPDGGPTEGSWFSLELCDGSVIQVWRR